MNDKNKIDDIKLGKFSTIEKVIEHEERRG